jgi:predicted carbohydrate-binding protein with CBM5 and CBM33 domain
MRKRTLLTAVAACTLLGSMVVATPASAHGWITSPGSRSQQCKDAPESFCGVLPKYTAQGAEAPKGSMQCSGGASGYSALDDNNKGWTVYNVGSTASFTWYHTAGHRTTTYEYFVDGRLHQTFNLNGAAPPASLTHTLTGLPSGRHLIFSRWNIYDTPMAFYQCIDVNVGGGGTGGNPPVTNPPAVPPTQPPTTTPPSTPGGTWAAWTQYAVGNTVTYGGATYRCILPHQSLPGWEPPNTPALWQRA